MPVLNSDIAHNLDKLADLLEINGQPDRLDLDEWHVKLAKEIGVKLVLSTDAHNPAELGFMRYAADQARRGWLEPRDIINSGAVDQARSLLRRTPAARR